jgi:FKBP-type peptidyl-prolyl cis-trans isomerase (trigger factor)
MRDREVDLFVEQLKDRLGSQGMDLDTYMKMRQMDMDALRAEAQPLAEKRLKQTLILLEIARTEEIEVSPTEIQAESARTLDELSHYLPPEKARKTFTNDFIRGMVGNISADLLIKRTTERLQAIAKGEYPPAEPTAEPGPEAAPEAAEVLPEQTTPDA